MSDPQDGSFLRNDGYKIWRDPLNCGPHWGLDRIWGSIFTPHLGLHFDTTWDSILPSFWTHLETPLLDRFHVRWTPDTSRKSRQKVPCQGGQVLSACEPLNLWAVLLSGRARRKRTPRSVLGKKVPGQTNGPIAMQPIC